MTLILEMFSLIKHVGVSFCVLQIDMMNKFLQPNGASQLIFYYQEPEPDKDTGTEESYAD